MNDRPRIGAAVPIKISSRVEPAVYQRNFEVTNDSSKHPHDIWNDPDLVPPPVVMLDDQEDEYGND